MALQTLSTLKGYFNTGDQPTESNFSDLLESTVQTATSGIVTLDTDQKTLIPAIAIPASSIITNYFIIATTAITAGSSTKIGHEIGTAADGEELSAADDNSLTNSTTSLTAVKSKQHLYQKTPFTRKSHNKIINFNFRTFGIIS